MTREATTQRRIRHALEARGAWVVKFNAGVGSPQGVPDLLCCVNGRFVGMEIKSATGHVSRWQARQLEMIQEAGGTAGVVHNVNEALALCGVDQAQ